MQSLSMLIPTRGTTLSGKIVWFWPLNSDVATHGPTRAQAQVVACQCPGAQGPGSVATHPGKQSDWNWTTCRNPTNRSLKISASSHVSSHPPV